MTEPCSLRPETLAAFTVADDEVRLPALTGGAVTLADLPPVWVARLQSLRRMLTRSQLCAHCTDWCVLDKAVWGGSRPDAEEFGKLFMGLLGQSAARPIAFHRVDTRAVSIDEIWMLRFLDAVIAGDRQNVRALIAFRVAPRARFRMELLSIAFVQALICAEDRAVSPTYDPHTQLGAA